jgi:protoheme IX farnesyltransferase
MLPAVETLERTVRQMVAYTVVLVAVTMLMLPLSDLGWIYGISAGVLGAAFLAGTIDLARRPTEARSMRLFGFSITYVSLLFLAVTADVLVRYGV